MKIKPREDRKTPVNISEWNDETPAFVKTLDIMEQIIFNDQLVEFHDKDADKNARAEAGISICILTLVDADGAPLLSLDDMDALKAAAFEPIGRVISTILGRVKIAEEAAPNP